MLPAKILHKLGQSVPLDTGPNPLTVSMGQSNVSTVYALMSAYNGQSFSVTFNGAGGSETFSGINLPDFNGGGSVNSCSGGFAFKRSTQCTMWAAVALETRRTAPSILTT
jgi:hypothetical protein